MHDGYVVVRTYLNELEAGLARNQLLARGLQADVVIDNCGGMRPHMDLTQGVRLMVPEADVPYARELLGESSGQAPGPAWQCPACNEDSEAGFDVCWKCGQERP